MSEMSNDKLAVGAKIIGVAAFFLVSIVHAEGVASQANGISGSDVKGISGSDAKARFRKRR